ncbi:MAG: hypothetical protein GXP37_10955 [Chloroflexi bacterium]|nr:hypothetical protein [Chloroflexota bacterium]
MKAILSVLAIGMILLVLTACQTSPAPPATAVLAPTAPQASPTPAAAPTEHPVTVIPLTGPLSKRRAEISSLAWYGDMLILMPQYPNFSTLGGDSFLYALPKADLLAFVQGQRQQPLTPQPIPLQAPGLVRQIPGYEGFEALAFNGNTVFMTIEARGSNGMVGYLLAGEVAPNLSGITLDTGHIESIASQSGLPNKAEEALFIAGEHVITLHEVNGAAVNPAPVAHVFTFDLAPLRTIPFPNIEFRITDATALDAEGRFWVINYFFPGDKELRSDLDPIAQRYGPGPTHARIDGVERLLAVQYREDGVTLVDAPPLQLQLLPEDLRNWEGLVRLDDQGFLLVTDKYPQTILGFVRR